MTWIRFLLRGAPLPSLEHHRLHKRRLHTRPPALPSFGAAVAACTGNDRDSVSGTGVAFDALIGGGGGAGAGGLVVAVVAGASVAAAAAAAAAAAVGFGVGGLAAPATLHGKHMYHRLCACRAGHRHKRG